MKVTCDNCGSVYNTSWQTACPECGHQNKDIIVPAGDSRTGISPEINVDADIRAESILNKVAKFVLIFSWFLFAVFLILGIVLIYDWDETLGVVSLFVGILLVVLGYIIWACCKLLINMSVNLFEIKQLLSKK